MKRALGNCRVTFTLPKGQDQIMYFLVNASSLLPWHVVISRFAGA